MDGLILIHKPQNCTSHDVVIKIREILNKKKVGHYGTLDPLATGLMMIAVGKATRLFPFFSRADKVYKGRIKLGFSTDTYDSFGKLTSEVTNEYPDKKLLLKLIEKFKGEITQVSPPFSAKKYKGKPLYALARQNKEFKLKTSKIFIHFFHLLNYKPPLIDFKVKCSSGTYIRSLAHDLGQNLECGAHLSQLTRTEVGNFNIKDCFTIDKTKKLAQENKIEEFLIPLELLLPEFPKIILKETGSALVKNGSMIFHDNILKVVYPRASLSNITKERENIFRMFSHEGKLLAFAEKIPEKKCLHPFLVFDSKDVTQ